MEFEETFETADGLLWLDRQGHEDFLAYGGHEAWLWPIVSSLLHSSAVFVDVGAHVGHYAVRCSSLCEKVVAIEVNPDTLKGLRKNIEVNGLSNVEVLPYAASDAKGYVRLENPHDSLAGGSTRIVDSASGRFPCDTLDELLSDLPRVDLIKMDIEGHEGKALLGATDVLLDHRPTIVLEMHHKMYGVEVQATVEQVLDETDYDYMVIHENPDIEYWLCQPREKEDFPADA